MQVYVKFRSEKILKKVVSLIYKIMDGQHIAL